MKTFAAREAKNGFGQVLDLARHEPVAIERHGRPAVVMIAAEEYARLEALENTFWQQKAEEGEASGWLGPEKSALALKELLRAKN
ncbi:MAG: type II toxin-antitoxin system Phd/YefM family antitoxin [Holosporales bacterium]|jgi:prevent-host-death family protein